MSRNAGLLYSPPSYFYRFEKGLHDNKISVAVVAQKMVESEVSGIAFPSIPSLKIATS